MELRPYQRQAVDAVYSHLRDKDTNPVVCIPTGGGKTPVIATICRDAVSQWCGRVLIVSHVKELLEQSAEKLRLVDDKLDVGIYSAGLGKRDCESDVVIAGIQSIYAKAEIFGHRDLILVDECHLIPTDGNGMYQRLLNDFEELCPNVRVIGFTATPFRMDSGMICRNDHFLNEICYEVGIKELINQGYLCKLSSKSAVNEVDLSAVKIRAGEYDADEMQKAYMADAFSLKVLDEMMRLSAGRNSTLIFASGVDHAKLIQSMIVDLYGYDAGLITGDTPDDIRAEVLDSFKTGALKWLVNVNVLTTGFDAPNIDCVVLLRATLSPGLFYQMVGRGLRTHYTKENCVVLDFGGNIKRHGCVDQLRIKLPGKSTGAAPVKICPECREAQPTGKSVCECGYEWPVQEKKNKLTQQAETDSPVSGEFKDEVFPVRDVRYFVHTKRGADPNAPKTMRVDYMVRSSPLKLTAYSEWICIEHEGFAGSKARHWWAKRSHDPFPKSATDAVIVAEAGALAHPEEITVRFTSGQQFPSVISHKLGPIPEYVETEETEEEVPW